MFGLGLACCVLAGGALHNGTADVVLQHKQLPEAASCLAASERYGQHHPASTQHREYGKTVTTSEARIQETVHNTHAVYSRCLVRYNRI